MLSTDCYVASCRDTQKAVVIDPGFDKQSEAEKVISYINEKDLEPKFIINTHGHPDHSCGNQIIKEEFKVPICIHEADAYILGKSGEATAKYFGYNCVSPSADILCKMETM